MLSPFEWALLSHHRHLLPHQSSLSHCFTADLIPSGYPCFALSWCLPLLMSTSAAVLSAGCCQPSCCASSTADSPSPSGRGPGSRKKTNRLSSKKPAAICPHLQFPLPICWQWKKLPPRKARAFELCPHDWETALSELLLCLSSFPLKEHWRNKKAAELLAEKHGQDKPRRLCKNSWH